MGDLNLEGRRGVTMVLAPTPHRVAECNRMQQNATERSNLQHDASVANKYVRNHVRNRAHRHVRNHVRILSASARTL